MGYTKDMMQWILWGWLLYQRHKVSGILFVVKAKLPLLAR